MTVEAGVILSDIHDYVKNLIYFPLNLGAKGSCMMGNLSTNAGGINVLKYGTTRAMYRFRSCFTGQLNFKFT